MNPDHQRIIRPCHDCGGLAELGLRSQSEPEPRYFCIACAKLAAVRLNSPYIAAAAADAERRHAEERRRWRPS